MDQGVKVLALAHYLEAWEGLGAVCGGRRIEGDGRLFWLLSSSQTSETALGRTRPCLSIIGIVVVAAAAVFSILLDCQAVGYT